MTVFRQHRRSLAGLAASLFLAVWASMAIAPCLMAAETIIGGGCPHCIEPQPPCHENGGSESCTFVDGYDFDGRQAALPKVEIELVALPAIEVAAGETLCRSGIHPVLAPRPPPDPGGPRLHLRNCVFND